jgi:hypothetical protein
MSEDSVTIFEAPAMLHMTLVEFAALWRAGRIEAIGTGPARFRRTDIEALVKPPAASEVEAEPLARDDPLVWDGRGYVQEGHKRIYFPQPNEAARVSVVGTPSPMPAGNDPRPNPACSSPPDLAGDCPAPQETTPAPEPPPERHIDPALHHLRSLLLPFDRPGADEPLPVIVARACRPLRPGDDNANGKIESALAMLLAIGMKPTGKAPSHLFIVSNHAGFQRALEGTPFHGQIGRHWLFAEMLGRVEGVRRNVQQWFAGAPRKGLLVPLALLAAPPAPMEVEL